MNVKKNSNFRFYFSKSSLEVVLTIDDVLLRERIHSEK